MILDNFAKIPFHKCNILLHLNVILIFLLLMVTFFSFQNQLYFYCVLLKIPKNFFRQSFPWYKVCLFSIQLNAQVVDIEYPQGICSPIFVVEVLSEVFAHPSICSIKDSMSA